LNDITGQGSVGGVTLGSDAVTGVTGQAQPRFVVRLTGIKVMDENSVDFPGSDEAVFHITANGYTLVTHRYENLDSNGQTYAFASRDSCVMPAVDTTGAYDHDWSCDETGTPAPLNFAIAGYEYDGLQLGFCANQDRGTDLFDPTWNFCEYDLGGFDFIGSDDASLDQAFLLEKMPTIGSTYSQAVWISGECDGTRYECKPPGEPYYRIFFEVRRVADVIDVSPFGVELSTE
jgi:hypothetical protein